MSNIRLPKIDLFCLASGPSLTKEDCDLVSSTGVKILAVNNSWKLTPRCDFLFAGDIKWWNAYAKEVPDKIRKYTSSKKAAAKFGINFFPASGAFNSGMRALVWALHNGFKNIVLLGFDCSVKKGVHWHGLHNKKLGLSNPDKSKTKSWHLHFLDVYSKALKFEAAIVNCSRYTELGCFPIASLEHVLGLPENIKSKEVKKVKETKENVMVKVKKSKEDINNVKASQNYER